MKELTFPIPGYYVFVNTYRPEEVILYQVDVLGEVANDESKTKWMIQPKKMLWTSTEHRQYMASVIKFPIETKKQNIVYDLVTARQVIAEHFQHGLQLKDSIMRRGRAEIASLTADINEKAQTVQKAQEAYDAILAIAVPDVRGLIDLL